MIPFESFLRTGSCPTRTALRYFKNERDTTNGTATRTTSSVPSRLCKFPPHREVEMTSAPMAEAQK